MMLRLTLLWIIICAFPITATSQDLAFDEISLDEYQKHSGTIYAIHSHDIHSGVMATTVVFRVREPKGLYKDFYQFFGSAPQPLPGIYEECKFYHKNNFDIDFGVSHPIETDATFSQYIVCGNTIYHDFKSTLASKSRP